MSNTRIYWLHALSPTHAGIGRGVGYIDLPIDRDRVTGWPIIRGSAFKGVWADHHKATKDARERDPFLKAAFGLADGDNSNSGSLIPTDAKLVCLPVRSFRGTFAWATSALCLSTLHRTLKLAGQNVDELTVPAGLPDGTAHYAAGKTLVEKVGDEEKLFLEDLDFQAKECKTATAWAAKIGEWVFGKDDKWCKEFQKRFVVLPDSAFDFLCDTGTEVQTRVKIDSDMKVVEKGMLWTEEYLPAETILAGIVQCERVFQRNGAKDDSINPDVLLKHFATTSDLQKPLILQIGGKATVGRGQMRCVFSEVK